MQIEDNILLSTQMMHQLTQMGPQQQTDTSSKPWWTRSESGSEESVDTVGLSASMGMMIEQLRLKILQQAAMENFEQDSRERTRAFAQAFAQALKDAGIDIGEGVDLVMDDAGAIRVRGGHPAKDHIESFLLASPEWRQNYADIHLRNQISRTLGSGAMTRRITNPYQRNQMAWEQCVISITPGSAQVSFV